jgi:hypothetical protein
VNKKFLGAATIAVLALTVLMIVAPVIASQPKTTINWGEIDVSIDSGIQWISDTSILHQRGSVANNWIFGSSWGETPVDLPGVVTIVDGNINLVTLSGGGLTKYKYQSSDL